MHLKQTSASRPVTALFQNPPLANFRRLIFFNSPLSPYPALILSISLFTTLQIPLIAVDEPQTKATQASGEKVGQYAIPVDTEFGTVEVYEQLVEKGHWYVGPIFRFKLVDSEKNLISRVSDTLTPGVKSVELLLELVTPDIRAEVREQLSSDGHLVRDVGNLRLYRIIVDLRSDSIKKELGIVPLKIDNPAFGQSIPVTFEVDQEKADKFSDLINSGGDVIPFAGHS